MGFNDDLIREAEAREQAIAEGAARTRQLDEEERRAAISAAHTAAQRWHEEVGVSYHQRNMALVDVLEWKGSERSDGQASREGWTVDLTWRLDGRKYLMSYSHSNHSKYGRYGRRVYVRVSGEIDDVIEIKGEHWHRANDRSELGAALLAEQRRQV